MRVRDEHKMTLAAYQTIYQSSITYGIKKQVESEEGIDQMEEQHLKLVRLKEELSKKKNRLQCKKEILEKEIKQNKNIQNEKRQEEIKFLKLQKDNMTKFL